ncbi:MAG TPA: winged helix-turn-helix domain-containing protein [Verrucomicrobiae bacterium]|nr:winged helix-turn-helix domain-containing protein [Verrucomicrobiae bacterium]
MRAVPAPETLCRTAAQIAAWLAQTHGIQRAAGSLYSWLGKAGGRLKVPRPAHAEQNPAAQAGFKAHLGEKLQALPLSAGRPVKVWVADECRVGLHTFTRRCRGLRGRRVVAPKQQRYQWEYVYGVEVPQVPGHRRRDQSQSTCPTVPFPCR